MDRYFYLPKRRMHDFQVLSFNLYALLCVKYLIYIHFKVSHYNEVAICKVAKVAVFLFTLSLNTKSAPEEGEEG